MHLLIRAVSLAGQPLTQAISAYFDERGGTIGRADTNTLALPDPERRISRLQAEVVQSADGYNLFNVGNANPIWQNEKAIGPGEGALLNEGDELLIGSYALQVSLSRNDETARSITQGRPAVDGRTVIVTSGQDPKTDPSLMTPIAGIDTQAPGVTRIPASAASAGGFGAPPVPGVPATPAPAPLPAVSVAPSSPFADLLGGLSAPMAQQGGVAATPAKSPFDDLLGQAPTPAPAFAPRPASASSSPSTPVTRLPDDFDPFADLLGSSKPTPAPAAPATRLPGDLDLMAELNPAGASSSLDQMFGLGGGVSADPLADFLKKTEPPVAQSAVGAPSAVDPLALLTPAPAAHQPPGEPPLRMPTQEPVTQAPLPDTTPEIHGSMPMPRPAPSLAEQLAQRMAESAQEPDGLSPPAVPSRAEVTIEPSVSAPTQPGVKRIVTLSPMVPHEEAPAAIRTMPQVSVAQLPPADWLSPPTPPVPPAQAVTPPPAVTPRPVAPAPAAEAAASPDLWAAFCEGAGVSFVPPQGLNPDLMRVMGQLLRHSVDGTLRLVAARAATKQEMRAEVTVIQARRNNPLKFSPDTQSAMEQLLQPPLRGFMSGPEAVDDAMDDLLGHTMGTMAGMRAALEGVLARFEPDQLETKLVGRSMLDSLLPMNRRAKLWELYLQHYGAVSTEATEDFHNLFGKAFLQAYEEQLDRLDAERRAQKEPKGQGGRA